MKNLSKADFWDEDTFYILRASNRQIALFNEINIGDLVFAKMPLPYEQLRQIEYSHRMRPYLVVCKDRANIYAYQLSSHKSNCLYMRNESYYAISKEKYGESKNSWINLTHLYKVPVNNLLDKMYSLDAYDLNMVNKRLQILKAKGSSINKTFDLKFNWAEGDVIRYSQNIYYVYSTNAGILCCYPLFETNEDGNNDLELIEINNSKRYVAFSEQIFINADDDIAIVDIANTEEILHIIEAKKRYHHLREEKEAIDYEIGSVFGTEEKKIMYLYKKSGTLYGIDLLLYKAFPGVVPIDNPDEPKIIEVRDKNFVNGVISYLTNNMRETPKNLKNVYRLLNE